MKKFNALSIIISIACVMSIFTSCGKQTEETKSKNDSDKKTVTTTVTTTKKETTTTTTVKEEPKQEKVPAEFELGENGAKAVCKVTLIPDEEIDISQKVEFDDLFGKHVLHSGVVGLVGAPLEVTFDKKEIKSGKLVFTYDPEHLKGVRPDSLIFLWYNPDEDCYVELNGELDEENNSVSLDISDEGVYLLVNKYKWFDAWGIDLGDDGMDPDYNPMDYLFDYSLWEYNAYTGDIPELADIDFITKSIEENENYFVVSTPQELASAVYYINVSETDARNTAIVLANDIDLSGIDWAPIGWYGAGIDYQYSGEIYGNGHTISNMTIKTNDYSGFIGEGYESSIYDLTFENAKIEGRVCGIVAASDIYVSMSNCHCTGEVNGIMAGTLLGEGVNADFSGCTVNVIVNDVRETRYLSFSAKETQEIIYNEKITEIIGIDKNSNVFREEGIENEYDNLQWNIKHNGKTVLERNAENETVLHFSEIFEESGYYTVTLEAYIGGYYIPISNTIEIDY